MKEELSNGNFKSISQIQSKFGRRSISRSAEGKRRSGASGRSSDGKININTADSTQLQELNGVGPATAEKIIDYRKQNGRFQSIEDIKNVSGIGDKTYEKLKDHIRV